jgi:hypothetical protein
MSSTSSNNLLLGGSEGAVSVVLTTTTTSTYSWRLCHIRPRHRRAMLHNTAIPAYGPSMIQLNGNIIVLRTIQSPVLQIWKDKYKFDAHLGFSCVNTLNPCDASFESRCKELPRSTLVLIVHPTRRPTPSRSLEELADEIHQPPCVEQQTAHLDISRVQQLQMP